MITHLVVAALLFLMAVASLVGVVLSHVLTTGGLMFGSSSGSLSIIAFSVSVMTFMKIMRACMGKGECCSGK
ncbi:MAG: hypothetical protein WCS85_02530 [Candidatus Peribacteraceae bacterium]